MVDRKRGPGMAPGLDRFPCLILLLTIDLFIPVSISASQRITHLGGNVKRLDGEIEHCLLQGVAGPWLTGGKVLCQV